MPTVAERLYKLLSHHCWHGGVDQKDPDVRLGPVPKLVGMALGFVSLVLGIKQDPIGFPLGVQDALEGRQG